MREDLLYLIGPHRGRFVLAALWGVSVALFSAVVNPLVLKYLFDEAVITQNFPQFLKLAALTVVVFTAWRFLDMGSRLYRQKLSNDLVATLSVRMAGAQFQLPFERMVEQEPGYLVARTHDEVEVAASPAAGLILDLCRAVATLLGGLGVVLLISWKLTLVLALVGPGLIWLSRHFSRQIRDQTQEEQEAAAHLRAAAAAVPLSHKAAQFFDLEGPVTRHYASRLSTYQRVAFARFRNTARYSTLSGVFLSWMETLVIISGGYGIILHVLTFGGLLAYMNAFWQSVNALQTLIDSVPRVASLRSVVARLREVEGWTAEPRPLPTESTLGALQFTDVTYGIGGRTLVQDASFAIPQGGRVLIRGPNGAGKSTLANILSGLLPVQSGVVHRPERISALVEPFELPPLPVRDLLPPVTPACADLLIRFALTDLMDLSYDRLSLGQKKKVQLLLALTREADLYVLDEPLANLDIESRNVVMKAVATATTGRTVVMIMHGADDWTTWFDHVLTLQPSARQPGIHQLHCTTPVKVRAAVGR